MKTLYLIPDPLILMHITSIAEQFDKLSKDAKYELLNHFDKNDFICEYILSNTGELS